MSGQTGSWKNTDRGVEKKRKIIVTVTHIADTET